MSTESSPAIDPAAEPVVIDGISYIPSSVLLTGIQKLSFKDDRAFGVLDRRGEALRSYTGGSELGLYYNDTRYLSTWETTFNGASPIALAHELRFAGSTLVISMTNPDMPRMGLPGRIRRDTLLIRRILTLHGDTLFEMLAIRNFDVEPHVLKIEHWAGGRFDDVFEVRGYARPRRGRMLPPDERHEAYGLETILAYEGLDGRIRRTHIRRHFESEQIRLLPTLAGYVARVEVPPKGDVLLKTSVSFDEPSTGLIHGRAFADLHVADAMELLVEARHPGPFAALSIVSDNAIVNRAVQNARVDIRMLLTLEGPGILYPSAGIPWFSAPFGRDGIITAYQCLPWHPEIARGVLDFTLSTLGREQCDFTDEQPGKVFHELRRGEMTQTREVPFIPYYGSVDSTPLCLILLHEYISWTMDLPRLKAWWPSALRALDWIERGKDRDGDGFLAYQKLSPTGLINQGWKDSHDSIMHADGRLAPPPIRLCEVQAYAYRARMGMSDLARLLGDEDLASRLRLDALRLRARFREAFWEPKRRFVHLAIDGNSEPCAVLSSNMGHALWTQILGDEEAESVSAHLFSESMFNGYGIRTLADTETAYNPMSYHNGSVWPHDNSLIMEGLRNYGHTARLERLALAQIGVLESSSDFRLPELFCGFRRRGSEPPVPYEVACKPQAWAAGSVFLMLKSMLGLAMDPDLPHVVLRSPLLTPKINYLEVRGLRGRDWELDLGFRRASHGVAVEVLGRQGNVRVITVK